MGCRSGRVEGSDHLGAAGPVALGSRLSSKGASGPGVSARLSPAIGPGGGVGVSTRPAGVNVQSTPAGLEARGPWAFLHLYPAVPVALASLSLGGWKDQGCSFFLFSFSGAWHLRPHRWSNQRPGRHSDLRSSDTSNPVRTLVFLDTFLPQAIQHPFLLL